MSGSRLSAQTAVTAPQATRTSVIGAVLCGSKKNRSQRDIERPVASRGHAVVAVGHVRVVRRTPRTAAGSPVERVRRGTAARARPCATGDGRSSYSAGDPPGRGLPQVAEVVGSHPLEPLAPAVVAEVGADPRALGEVPHRGGRRPRRSPAPSMPEARAPAGRARTPPHCCSDADQPDGVLARCRAIGARRSRRQVRGHLGQQHEHDRDGDQDLRARHRALDRARDRAARAHPSLPLPFAFIAS